MTTLAPETWRRLLRRDPADAALSTIYGPLLARPAPADGCYVLGRIAQSVDGRIATASGASHWISGPADIIHTHRLRALFDAVVIGAGTVRADDPQLTTREVDGPRRCASCSTPTAGSTRATGCSATVRPPCAVCPGCPRRGSPGSGAGASPAARRQGARNPRRAGGAASERAAACVRLKIPPGGLFVGTISKVPSVKTP